MCFPAVSNPRRSRLENVDSSSGYFLLAALVSHTLDLYKANLCVRLILNIYPRQFQSETF